MSVVRGSFGVMTIAFAVLGSSVGAQSISSPYRFIDASQSIGPWGGIFISSRGTVGLAPEGGQIGGLRYNIRLSGPFTVEAEAGFVNSKRAVRDTVVVDNEQLKVGEADQALALLLASLRFNLTGSRTWHRLQPFVAFGVGAALDLTGESTADALVAPDVRFDFGTSFAGHFGGGIEWFLNDRFSLRGDARNVLWKVNTPFPFMAGALGLETPEDEWIQNGVFTLGLSIHF